MKWRRWFRALHRDVGYVAVALTIAYALSGLAVNHIEHWNPNHRFVSKPVDIGPVPGETAAEQAAVVVERLVLDPAQVRGHFQESLTDLRIFLPDGQEVRLDVRSGRGQRKLIERRAVLYEVNALHLNNLKGVWTYVADAFALALMFLAITGMTMMKGSRGLAGRGKWFVGAGLLVPIGFVIYMYQ